MSQTRKRGWIWFFVLLAVMTTTAIVLETWFNLRQQLDPQKLAAAQQRWQENGPKSYDLEYTVARLDSARAEYSRHSARGTEAIKKNGAILLPTVYAFHPAVGELFDGERTADPGAASSALLTTISVEVRKEKVVSVRQNGQFLPAALGSSYDMAALLRGIQWFWDHDVALNSPRTYTSASFDPQDGRINRYVRSSRSPKERVEIVVKKFQRRD